MKNNNFLEAQFLETLGQEVQRSKTVSELPPGYIEIRLSTKGKVGAPAVFHVRNFSVGELLDLSLTSDTDLPRRLISILNDAIYEDVNVANWHESEIEELMIYIYAEFYKGVLDDVVFPLQQEDYDAVLAQPGGDQYLKDLQEKKWIPRVTINLLRDVDAYDVAENFTPEITITNKKTGFYVTFSYIKYGDRLVVKNWLDNFYKEEERKFDKLVADLRYNSEASNVDKKREIDKEEEEAYRDFISKKLRTLTEVSRLISVVNCNGQDVSQMTLDEKYALLSKEARIDYGMISKLALKQDKQPFGLKPFIHMINPITEKPCTRRFSFRISSTLQAMQLSGSDEYDDGSDDEDIQ